MNSFPKYYPVARERRGTRKHLPKVHQKSIPKSSSNPLFKSELITHLTQQMESNETCWWLGGTTDRAAV